MSKLEVLPSSAGTLTETLRPQHAPGIRVRHTAEGWRIDLDTANWAEVMTALSIAIDSSDQERQRHFVSCVAPSARVKRILMLAFLHSRRVAHDLEAGKLASKEVSS